MPQVDVLDTYSNSFLWWFSAHIIYGVEPDIFMCFFFPLKNVNGCLNDVVILTILETHKNNVHHRSSRLSVDFSIYCLLNSNIFVQTYLEALKYHLINHWSIWYMTSFLQLHAFVLKVFIYWNNGYTSKEFPLSLKTVSLSMCSWCMNSFTLVFGWWTECVAWNLSLHHF